MVGCAGSGSDWSEELVAGVSTSRAGRKSRSPSVLPGPPRAIIRVSQQLSVDGVGQASFQTAHGFFMSFAGGAFALVVGAAFGVVPDLGQRHYVQGVVESPVTRS